ncbi:MAG: SCO family protein, partial [Planctomycetaceae bacterium]
MTDAAAVTHRRLRVALLVLGGVMWVAVFVVLFRLWDERRKAAADNGSQQTGQPVLPSKPAFQPYKLPDFTLEECRGGTIGKSDLLGKPWVASFIFTRCRGQCPKINAQMKELQSRLGDTNVRLVTISVDPRHDTPAVLKRLAKKWNAPADRWLFLTGRQEDVYRLIHSGFKLAVAQNTGNRRTPGNEVTHSHRVLHVDETGTVVGAYDGRSTLDMIRLRQVLTRKAAE